MKPKMNSELSNISQKSTIFTDEEFKIKVGNSVLTRLYKTCCGNEVEKLFKENGWKNFKPERIKMIDDLYEDLKPAFINFAHSDNNFNDLDKLPILFSNHIKILERRKKIEKFTKKK
jgi:hypothetical protein